MTCIVGLEHDGKVYIGGDAAGTGDTRQAIMTEPKVFRRGAFVIGYTTSFRMGQLLQHTLKAPSYTAEWQKRGPHAFMTVRFVDAVRKCLEAGGWLTKKNEQIEGGTFLVGFRDQLFAVESDLQVGRVIDGFWAVGSGSGLALGSLHTSRSLLWPDAGRPDQRITLALEAAARFDSAVAGPFTIEATR